MVAPQIFRHVQHPADALANDDDEDTQRLSAFVGNAVGRGSYGSYQWHCDADPSQLPWDSPWAQYHGVHYNREVWPPESKPSLEQGLALTATLRNLSPATVDDWAMRTRQT